MTNPTPDRKHEDETIFARALSLPESEQEAFLAATCPEERRRDRIRALLRASAAAKGFMDVSPVSDLAAGSVPDLLGQKVDRYKLLQKIGEGGCGVVYMAEQEEPVRRRVALKVIKLGMDTQAVIARFEAERQALALMDHPNIAHVLDAGATGTGRPYFVMELVRGVKITDYCDQHKLGPRERLELFAQVCRAVQHAHQKGVIHRDLKPSNVLVTLQDGAPVPKIIDFGIAKATQGRLTDQTLFTAFEQFIGTPAYMSPEQAEMTSQDVDTRSDIYSLGVLLYELLTGRTPFDAQAFRQAGIDEIRRLIREEEPPRPSHRFGTLTEAESTTVASLRGTDRPKLSLLLRGDVDWIVMKALDKNRTRRYETASAFAADVERYLQDEPVVARPPSRRYLLGKFIRRNRGVFAAVTAVGLVLVAGLCVSTWTMVKEKRARERAVAAEKAQAEARAKAEVEEARAKVAAEKSRQAYRFIEGMLSEVKPSVALGRDTTLLREVLDKTAKRLDLVAKEQPEVTLAVRTTLAGTYLDMGDYAKTETMAREALALAEKTGGRDGEDAVAPLVLLGNALILQGRTTEADPLFKEALVVARKHPGAKNENLATALVEAGGAWVLEMKLPEAEAALREALPLVEKSGDENLTPDAVEAMLSSTLQAEGRLAEAETLSTKALVATQERLPADDPMIGYALMSLSRVHEAQGKLTEAEKECRTAQALLEKTLGPEHPTVAMARLGLVRVLATGGRFGEAESLCREVLELQRKVLGPKHPTTLNTEEVLRALLSVQKKSVEAEALTSGAAAAPDSTAAAVAEANRKTNAAMAALAAQKFPEAAALLGEAIPVFEKVAGKNRPDVVGVRVVRVRALLEADQLEEADRQAAALEVDCRSSFGDSSVFVCHVLLLRATLAQRVGKIEEAEKAFREGLTLSRGQSAEGGGFETASILLSLASVKSQQMRLDERERLVSEAVGLLAAQPENVKTGVVKAVEATAVYLQKKGRYLDAVAVEQVVVSAFRQLFGPDSDALVWALGTYAWFENEAGKSEEAESSARESVAIRRRTLPADHWFISTAEYSVAESLFDQQKFDEAELMFLRVFENLQKHGPENSDPLHAFWRERLRYSAEYLSKIYAKRGQDEKAAAWKTTSEKFKDPAPATPAPAKP